MVSPKADLQLADSRQLTRRWSGSTKDLGAKFEVIYDRST